MHGALRNQSDLQAQLNRLNSRESVQIQSLFLLTKTSRERQYQALTEQLISNFRFLGNFELTLVYTLLEQHFGKSGVNDASKQYKQPDTRTRRIVHKWGTISPKLTTKHAAQAALRSYQKAASLAGNPATENKCQGCEGQHAVLVRSVYVFILLAIDHAHLERRTAAQAEPVAARPRRAGNAGQGVAPKWIPSVDPIFNNSREDLRKQRKNAQIYTNTKIFQQYQAMFDNLLEQIEAQNRATQTQATSDAIAAGFIQSGSQFIKAGAGAESFGVVDAVVGFDGVTAIREEQQRHGSLHGLRGTGAEPASYENRDIIRFLESADSVQVEAFFDHQKLVFGKVAESIMGAGKPEERSATLQPNEEIHGRLGVWLGRPSDQKITQGLLEAAGDSYYNDKEALQRVAQSATGYGELGAAAVRPSGIGAGFYTQLWFYNQQFERENAEVISAPYNAGLLETGIAKYYNSWNPMVMMANTYREMKTARDLRGADSGALWSTEGAKIVAGLGSMAGGIGAGLKVNKHGKLSYKMTERDLVGGLPLVGGFLVAGMDLNPDGTQRRGGLKWNPKKMGAAALDLLKIVPVFGEYPSEYLKKQMVGEEYSGYDELGTNVTFGDYIVRGVNAIVGALTLRAALAESGGKGEVTNSDAPKGESRLEAERSQTQLNETQRIAEQANKTAQQQAAADIYRGAGYGVRNGAASAFGRHLKNQFTSGVTFGLSDGAAGFGNYAMNQAFGQASGVVSNFGQRVGNFFGQDFAGNRWNWETDAQQQQRALQEVTTLASLGDLEQARQLVGELGLSDEQVDQLRKQLDQNYKRDISMTRAAYEAREVAAQFGVAKDGQGILYNEVLAELRKITGPDKQACTHQKVICTSLKPHPQGLTRLTSLSIVSTPNTFRSPSAGWSIRSMICLIMASLRLTGDKKLTQDSWLSYRLIVI